MYRKIFTLALVFTITSATNDYNHHQKLKPSKNENTFEDDVVEKGKAINPPLSSTMHEEGGNNQRIINGNEANPHSRTYQAGLIVRRLRNGFQTQHICGGSILSKNIILTTGFCIEHSHTTIVVLGAHYLFNESEISQQRFSITNRDYIFHPMYNSSGMSNDIALLKLPRNAVFNAFVQPIDILSESYVGKSLVGERVDVAGWGRFSDWSQNYSSYLKYSINSVVENAVCASYFFGPLVYNTTMCLETYTTKSSACRGDHGSAVVWVDKEASKRVVIGIASFGVWFWNFGCEPSGLEIYANMNTDIRPYIQWVQKTIKNFSII